MDKTRNKRKRVKKSASTTVHQMLKRQKHMSEQGLSRADVLATKPAELRVLDDRTKGQAFVCGQNTEELVAGRIKLRPYTQGRHAAHPRSCRNNLTLAAEDGIKDPHYPADVASVKVKEHANKVANRLAVFGKENIKPELLPHFEGLQPLVTYLTGVVESLVHWEAFEIVADITKEVATTCDPIFGIFMSSFLACSNNGGFKFHLDSKNSTFGINFTVVVDEEDAELPGYG
ncbi:hypothetical protein BDR26DRAFT_956465 [Obelidium mucronatum]|nr:hypothetical protein BDR26DRAFT_956465 [Obelidium mucronatum]